MDIIRLLPDAIANQIAAGEVVQRPASVVKELLENAIDAKASQVSLIVREAGKTLIQVIDNGIGMSVTDARLSFERHATSKIRTSEDLFQIRTMGFRGEALASISAVAQVELRTKRNEDELAIIVKMEGSEFKAQEFETGKSGTQVLVKNLFFNVPARRNFLKSNPVEMKHILDEFMRVALAYPEVGFELYHNDTQVYLLPVGNLQKRIVDLLDKSYKNQLSRCEEHTPLVKVSGFVGQPQLGKKAKGEQFFFVNQRYIKNSYLNHAVLGAFEGTLRQGYYPFYVLFLEIDPQHIDINIHPTKTEIKFDDEKAIYAILRSAVKKALGAYNLSPSLDFESDINFGNVVSGSSIQSFGSLANLNSSVPTNVTKHINSNSFPSRDTSNENIKHWEKLFEGFENKDKEEMPERLDSLANQLSEDKGEQLDPNNKDYLQLHNRFIFTQVKSGVMIVDQRGAFERIFYEKKLKEINKKKISSQMLLFPVMVQLNPQDFQVSLEIIEELRDFGFVLEDFGPNAYMLSAVPSDFLDANDQILIQEIIDNFKFHQNALKQPKKEALAKSLAKRQALWSLKTMSSSEMTSMISLLFETQLPTLSPDGQLIVKILTLEEIVGIFSE